MIEQGKLDRIGAENLQGLGAAGGAVYLIALFLQKTLQGLALQLFIIHHKNFHNSSINFNRGHRAAG